MNRVRKYISRRLFKQPRGPDEAEAAALRIAFKDRYHHFKLLLTANNQALRKMADIERALAGEFEFGMAFVRDRCASTSVNVLQMITHLAHLAPEKYAALHPVFTVIHQRINEILSVKSRHASTRLVIPMDDAEAARADLVGAKMAVLGEIKNRLAFNVPPGFTVTIHSYERFLTETGLREEINRLIQSADLEDLATLYGLSAQIRQQIIQTRIPRDIADAIQSAWSELDARTRGRLSVAFRSSALGEDAAGNSFAGQYHSALNVRGEDLLDAYRRVVASKFNLQAIVYRLNHGLRDEDIPMAVGCLRMVDAVAGGVVYSRNPVRTEDDAILINAVWGLPKAVVDGSTPCDLFIRSRVAPHPALQSVVRDKTVKYTRCDTDSGVCRNTVGGGMAARPALNENQQTVLAEIALKLESHFGHAQDMEWALGPGGEIHVLQSRALHRETSDVARHAPPADLADGVTVLVEGGIVVSSGAAHGEVRVVEKHADAIRFPKGGILVTRQALPVWATLLNRAAAVVTTQGGVAGHLASVAREFGIPALFGLADALEKLPPGARVTVDADNRRIYAGRVDAVIRQGRESTPRMADRPVYQILKKAGQWIVPLNLLDPDAREFAPQNCRTYHDITRFVHEKSVHEMFTFGKDHHFPERSGKQLFHEVPMQWWVLNLDDGFKEEVNGKYVRLENILSLPMLAFWEGFAAVPWDGPPAVDGKGLLSVMFQSTANPALATGGGFRQTDQNYFMISKHFCSLSSRLGYHFATLETLMGGRPGENYIRYQFKGGAADPRRRTRRAAFIGDILENFGFLVKVREDHLIARVQEAEHEYMRERLAILGYLTLHTRQLDMVMNNPRQVTYYKSKLQDDLEKHILRKCESLQLKER